MLVVSGKNSNHKAVVFCFLSELNRIHVSSAANFIDPQIDPDLLASSWSAGV